MGTPSIPSLVSSFHFIICVTASPMFGCSNKLLLLLACCYCPKSQHSKMAVPDRFLVFFFRFSKVEPSSSS